MCLPFLVNEQQMFIKVEEEWKKSQSFQWNHPQGHSLTHLLTPRDIFQMHLCCGQAWLPSSRSYLVGVHEKQNYKLWRVSGLPSRWGAWGSESKWVFWGHTVKQTQGWLPYLLLFEDNLLQMKFSLDPLLGLIFLKEGPGLSRWLLYLQSPAQVVLRK